MTTRVSAFAHRHPVTEHWVHGSCRGHRVSQAGEPAQPPGPACSHVDPTGVDSGLQPSRARGPRSSEATDAGLPPVLPRPPRRMTCSRGPRQRHQMSPRTHPGRQEPEPRAQGLRQPQGVGKLAGGVCRGPLTGHGPPGQSVVSAWCMSPPRGPPRGPRPGCSQERAGGPSFMSAVQRAASRGHRQPPLEAVPSACSRPHWEPALALCFWNHSC